TKFKFDDIQDAAFAFIKQLRRGDRVTVVSFDNKVRFHCDFTSDYDELRRAIDETRINGATKLYDAVDKVIDLLEPIQGRKAIVIFTDGVDTASRHANYQNTIVKVEESGAIVYPIKYDTEDDVRRGGVNGPTTSPWPWPNPYPSPPGRRRWPFSPFAGRISSKWPSTQ